MGARMQPGATTPTRRASAFAAPNAPLRRRRAAAVAARAAKLLTNPSSRGKIVEFYLAELGDRAKDVAVEQVDMRAGAHKAADFPHPFKQVPVLVTDDGLSVFESGAILLYLAARYGGLEAARDVGRVSSWVLWANSGLCDALFGGAARKRDEYLDALDAVLAKQPWLAGGDEPTVADVAVGSYLLYLPLFGQPLPRQARVVDYMKRLAARPACPAAYKEGLAAALGSGGGGGDGGGLGGLLNKITGGGR